MICKENKKNGYLKKKCAFTAIQREFLINYLLYKILAELLIILLKFCQLGKKR